MMSHSRAESTRDTYNYGQYINQFPPNTIKVIREFERIQKKICRHKMSIMFNEICINKEMLPKYTYFNFYMCTVYIILMFFCFFYLLICMSIWNSFGNKTRWLSWNFGLIDNELILPCIISTSMSWQWHIREKNATIWAMLSEEVMAIINYLVLRDDIITWWLQKLWDQSPIKNRPCCHFLYVKFIMHDW